MIDIKPEELELRLVPLKGLEFVGKGVLEFGMTRDEVWDFFEKHFGVGVAEVRQKVFNHDRRQTIRPLIHWISVGFRKETDLVECVEVVDDCANLLILERRVFSMSMLEALRWCREIDAESYHDDERIVSSRYGFLLGTQEIDWRRLPAQGAVVFEENYA
jgi:hypothetical protein